VGKDYYRLESVDSAGKDSFYPVLSVVVPTPPPPLAVLPVSLTLYTAMLESNGTKVDVDWTTALEQGNKAFVVLRSTDSVHFTSLDTITSQAPPGGGYAYVNVDSTAVSGNNHYRVESIDINGHDSLYAILKVVVGKNATLPPLRGWTDSLDAPNPAILQLSPNPTTGLLDIQLVDSTQGNIHVSVTDMNGRVLRSWEFQKQGMLLDQPVDVSGLPRGYYVLMIREKKARYVQTILKE
jgi:hypothetical protein